MTSEHKDRNESLKSLRAAGCYFISEIELWDHFILIQETDTTWTHAQHNAFQHHDLLVFTTTCFLCPYRIVFKSLSMCLWMWSWLLIHRSQVSASPTALCFSFHCLVAFKWKLTEYISEVSLMQMNETIVFQISQPFSNFLVVSIMGTEISKLLIIQPLQCFLILIKIYGYSLWVLLP